MLSPTPLRIPCLAVGHKLSSCVDTELGTENTDLSLLLYQICCQGLGEWHLLIAQPKLDSSLGYEHRFHLGKEGSGREE